jgi:predicted secreted protein
VPRAAADASLHQLGLDDSEHYVGVIDQRIGSTAGVAAIDGQRYAGDHRGGIAE